MGAIKGKKELANHYWEKKSKTAVVILDNKDTIKLSIGGCTHHYTKVAYVSRQAIPVDSLDYWLYKADWIMHALFDTAYQEKFHGFLKPIRDEYIKTIINAEFEPKSESTKNTNHLHLDFPKSTALTNEYFDGIDIRRESNFSIMKIEWYLN